MSHPSPHLPLLAAGLSGLLTPLAFAPYRQFWLMPLLLAGLIWLTWHYASTVRQAFRLGYIWGFFAYLAQFYWIFHSLHDVGGMPSWMAVPVTMLFPAYLALYPALAMALTRQLGRQRPMVWLIALPTSWTLSEWLRATLFSGFPWGNVGYSQIPESPLSPLAPIVGIYGIAWVVCLTAAALALVWVLTKKAKNGLVFGIATLWLGSWGLMQAEVGWTSPQGSPFSVALVQGNIPQDLKWQPNQFRHTIDVYENLIGQQKASLVVLPETAIPSTLEQTPLSDLAVLVQAARKQDSELASGVAYQSPSGTQYYNGVVSLTSPKPPYGKNHLVPFGEFVPMPLVTGWVYRFLEMPLSGFSQGGEDQPLMEFGQQKIAFNVCYEDSFGGELAAHAQDATLLVNVSNLAWFDPSNASEQHLQISQARALETGRWMLRATNTGSTAALNQKGEVVQHLPPRSQGVLTVNAQGWVGSTPFTRWKDTPMLLLCGLSLAWLVLTRNKRT